MSTTVPVALASDELQRGRSSAMSSRMVFAITVAIWGVVVLALAWVLAACRAVPRREPDAAIDHRTVAILVEQPDRSNMITLLGFAASFAVLATFLMRTMLPLRIVAVGSNVLFIAYGYCAHILPVLCLHLALLPINIGTAFRIARATHRPRSIRAGWPIQWGMSEDADH